MKRLLLVSYNSEIVRKVADIFSQESVELVYVHTMNDAIEQIINDGFDLTIIDAKTPFEKKVNIYELNELLDLSIVAGKITILLSSLNTTLFRVKDKILKQIHVVNQQSESFEKIIKETLNYHKPNIDDKFNDIFNEIISIRENSFFSHHHQLNFFL